MLKERGDRRRTRKGKDRVVRKTCLHLREMGRRREPCSEEKEDRRAGGEHLKRWGVRRRRWDYDLRSDENEEEKAGEALLQSIGSTDELLEKRSREKSLESLREREPSFLLGRGREGGTPVEGSHTPSRSVATRTKNSGGHQSVLGG